MKDTATRPPGFVEDEAGAHDDLRRRISAAMLGHADTLASDTVAALPPTADNHDPRSFERAGYLLVQMLAFAVRDARVDQRASFVADFCRVVLERGLTIEQVFHFVYLTERTVLDELALDETLGATSEPWPLVAQFVRRGSFDVLTAYTERSLLEPSGAAITDRLTTLFTRPVFDAALIKALDRAGRFGDPLSLILFDVDHLAAINANFGYGVGDRILERLGILIRGYFRQHDWIARYSEDSIAVLLSRTDPQPAADLAEHLIATVQERLEFTDHRSDRPVRVTISAALLNIVIGFGETIDPGRLMTDAEAALDRAKSAGRNRVERVDRYPGKAATA
jgi:diguanylate cyclase (GGDEF)-like protein